MSEIKRDLLTQAEQILEDLGFEKKRYPNAFTYTKREDAFDLVEIVFHIPSMEYTIDFYGKARHKVSNALHNAIVLRKQELDLWKEEWYNEKEDILSYE